jgi:hypothetical protein
MFFSYTMLLQVERAAERLKKSAEEDNLDLVADI